MKTQESWSAHSLSSLNLHQLSTRLPIRPQTLPDETFYSWILRLARANMSSVYKIVKRHYIYPQYKMHKDLSPSLVAILNEKADISENELKTLISHQFRP